MKKLLLMAAVAAVGLLKVNAQDLELGVQAGYGISNIYVGETSAKSHSGFHVGAVGQYNLDEDWSIVAKVYLDQKGYQYTDGTDGEERITYLTVPIMGKWYFGNELQGYVQGGLYLGYFLSATGEIENTDVDTSEFYNPIDGGIAFGVGVEYPIQDNINLFLELEVQSGMVNIAEANEVTVQNGASKLGVGFRYVLD